MNLKKHISEKTSFPYVYSYPPTRAYMPVSPKTVSTAIFSPRVNLYIHIPFCEQKCSFCGFLTTVDSRATSRDEYVTAVCQEIERFAYHEQLEISSVNFGGGTPMLLSEDQVSKIMRQLNKSFSGLRKTATEICMEATPESVTDSKIKNLKGLGFNRVSIGVQSFDASEIRLAKRHNLPAATRNAIEIIRRHGIGNLCCDLMYGLQGQTIASWQQTVSCLLEYMPETIELYRTVLIPDTGLFRIRDAAIMTPEEKYQAYEYASQKLIAAGYIQDSHLRFTIPNRGFYQQQANVFKGESLIGFGVAARTYAENMHYRNSYGSNGRTAIARYIAAQTAGESAIDSAIILSEEEKLRRYLIYNLESLDIEKIKNIYGCDIDKKFESVWQLLKGQGLIRLARGRIELTEKASYFRDTIAAYFFSADNASLENDYYKNINRD